MNLVDTAILAKTRAEEHDDDVWGEFFIPPYFDRIALRTATKSSFIVGKRGCGKTMLLKYLDYHTAFSTKRLEIPNDEIKHIGIYWRIDTQFCNAMKYRSIDEFEWTSIFESYFSVVVASHMLKAVRSIAESAYSKLTAQDLGRVTLPSIPDFHESFPAQLSELSTFLDATRRAFSTWVSNTKIKERPLLPPGRIFLDALIADIRRIGGLEEACFYVYVDEIENLVTYQRRFLNTQLKHSQRPLIVCFTTKELDNEMRTVGNESINATHDFRLIRLEDSWKDIERSVFFAEVFLGNLEIAMRKADSPLLQSVRSTTAIKSRSSSAYRDSVLKDIRQRFPELTFAEIAKRAFETASIRRLLEERIENALQRRRSSLRAEDFLSLECPEAQVMIPALISRERLSPDEVLQELRIYAASSQGAFKSTWIHNNLVGALIELYRPYSRDCPIYSGFDTFCTMANSNLRHFIILGYKAIEIAELKDEEGSVFSIETQSRAAYEAADQLIREIKTFGELGEQLRIFVLRLGSIFRAFQAQPAMSEPEQNQFTINSGVRALSEAELHFLSEAEKYGILSVQLETKTKARIGRDVVDYQLNPIYSPYFHISYRRKRKIELSVEQFAALASGTEDAYQALAGELIRSTGTDGLQAHLDI